MARFEDYVDRIINGDRATFEKVFAHPFLVLELEGEEPGGEWSFKTTTVQSKKINVAKLLSGSGMTLADEADRYHVFPLAKGSGSRAERLSVGRARNNDLVLPHKSVSKLHAHISYTEGDTKEPTLELADAGSRNGTKVNGKRVQSGTKVAVEVGDEITFGGITMQCVTSSELFDLIRRNIRKIRADE